MDQWRRDGLSRSMELYKDQTARMRSIRFSAQRIRAMSDDEIMSVISGDADIEGTLYPAMLHLLSTELNRREIQRSSQPHWTTTPAFILSAVAAVASVVAAVASVAALLKVNEPALQVHPPAAEYSSQKEDSSMPQPQK